MKGISPLIASVLLMAFTISVAMLAGPFFSETLKSVQKGTKERTEKVAAASEMSVSLESLRYDGFDRQFEVTIRNSGSRSFSNFSTVFLGKSPVQDSWGRELSSQEISTVNIQNDRPQDYDKLRVSLENYPVSAESDIVTRRFRPAEEKRFIVNSYHSGAGLSVASFENDNNITAGSCHQVVDAGSTYSFSSGCYSVTDTVTAEAPFSAHFQTGGSDGPVPESFAGKEFVYEDCRNGEHFNVIAPYGAASVTVRNSTDILKTTTITKGGHKEFSTNTPTGSVYTLKSNQSVLATYDRSHGDLFMMHPTTDDLWGLMESLTVARDNTYIEGWDSDGNKVIDGVYDSYSQISLAAGNQGGNQVHHVRANKSALGAWRCADSDNGETD